MGKRKKRALFTAGAALIAAGLLFASFPWLKAVYYEYQKNNMLTRWGAYTLLTSPAGEQIAKGIDKPAAPVYSGMSFSDKPLGKDGVLEEDANPKMDQNYMLANMTGIITIQSINLRSPILKGDTVHNLDLGIREVTGTVPMGSRGNYVLAGHKSRIYGRHFSRLSEVAIGDVVTVCDGLNTYKYEVTDKLHVSADDTWVMDDTADSVMTMITCDYTRQPIGRLAVKARLKSDM